MYASGKTKDADQFFALVSGRFGAAEEEHARLLQAQSKAQHGSADASLLAAESFAAQFPESQNLGAAKLLSAQAALGLGGSQAIQELVQIAGTSECPLTAGEARSSLLR